MMSSEEGGAAVDAAEDRVESGERSAEVHGAYTAEDARKALDAFARANPDFRQDAATKMDLVSLEAFGAYEVIVDTFVEQREIGTAYVPSDEPVPAAPGRGGRHSRWSIPVDAPEPFDDCVQTRVVPRTVDTVTCPSCSGERKIADCPDCGGEGRRRCPDCVLYPEADRIRCKSCGGEGTQVCKCEAATGTVPCPDCHASGMVHRFRRLTITWATLQAKTRVTRGNLPEALLPITHVLDVIDQEEAPRLYERPLERGALRVNETVHRAVNELLAEADGIPGDAKIRRQRLTVRGLPVYEGHYELGAKEGRFWIVGRGESVYAPDFPRAAKRPAAVWVVAVGVLVLTVAGVAGWVFRTEVADLVGRNLSAATLVSVETLD